MYSEIAQLFSIIAIVIYIYFTTRAKIPLLVIFFAFSYAVYFLVTETLLAHLKKPNTSISFESPIFGLVMFLIQIFIPLSVYILLLGIRISRKDAYSVEQQNLRSIVSLSKRNIIFWSLIVLLIAGGFFLDH